MRLFLRKTSLLDYPGRVAAVVFVRGCNLRCPWCHNPDLVLPDRGPGAGWEAPAEPGLPAFSPEGVLGFLEKRRPVLGGVVLSGGEPCLWEDLPRFIAEIKKLTLPVKLDTNGTIPLMLEQLLREEAARPDYIALDLKLAPSRYGDLLPRRSGEGLGPHEEGFAPARGPLGETLKQSAALIRSSGIAHEFRTLAMPGRFITEEDIGELAPLVDGAPWYFRPFRGGNCLESAWNGREENPTEAGARLETLIRAARDRGKRALRP